MNKINELLKSFNKLDWIEEISQGINIEIINTDDILTFSLNYSDDPSCSNTICCGAYSSEECHIRHSILLCPKVSCDDYLKNQPELIELIILRLEEELLKSL